MRRGTRAHSGISARPSTAVTLGDQSKNRAASELSEINTFWSPRRQWPWLYGSRQCTDFSRIPKSSLSESEFLYPPPMLNTCPAEACMWAAADIYAAVASRTLRMSLTCFPSPEMLSASLDPSDISRAFRQNQPIQPWSEVA